MTFNEISQWYEESAWIATRRQNAKSKLSHKALQPEGVVLSKLRSSRYAEDYVLGHLGTADGEEPVHARVFELGCGFASSMLYMSNIEPNITFAGICASDIELEAARAYVRDDGKVQRVSVFKGDYEDPNNFRVFAPQDLVYSIESLGELRDPELFMSNMKKLMKPGAVLVIVDYWKKTQGQADAGTVSRAGLLQAAGVRGFSCAYEADWSAWLSKDFLKTLIGGARDLFFSVFAAKKTGGRLSALEISRKRGVRNGSLGYGVMVFKAAD